MGLDITAYERLELIVDCQHEEKEHVVVQDPRQIRVHDRLGTLAPGCYRSTGAERHFRAGSYSSYNHWREQLAKLAGYPAVPFDQRGTGHPSPSHAAACWQGAVGPFSELIDFSDCEGVLGPEVCAKLADDFSTHLERPAYLGDWLALYDEWHAAFTLAAGRGCVKFS